jgi:capsular exopolysaccharide synthesis family protein
MSQEEKKIVLVDADLRRPSIHSYLNLPNRKGLSDVFRNQAKLSNILQTWGNPSISVITSGEMLTNPSELLASSGMGRVINELEERFDIVVIDSPPAVVIDPIVLSAKVDGVVIVIEPGKTRIGAAQMTLEQLQRAGARVIGIVLNPVSQKNAQYSSNYPGSTYFLDSHSYRKIYGDNNFKKQGQEGRRKLEDREDSPAN